jgi:hypothetical protein
LSKRRKFTREKVWHLHRDVDWLDHHRGQHVWKKPALLNMLDNIGRSYREMKNGVSLIAARIK